MTKKFNRYDLVHEIAKLAKEEEFKDRDEMLRKEENQIYKTINEAHVKRNYVLEAYERLMDEGDESTERVDN